MLSHAERGAEMQIRCKFYGLRNASFGIEYSIEHHLLAVGEPFHCNDQEYVILSVGESQGQWFANVAPATWRQAARPLRTRQGTPNGTLQARGHSRVTPGRNTRESQLDTPAQVDARLDQLIRLLERLNQDAHEAD